jgi:hypothetical protein
MKKLAVLLVILLITMAAAIPVYAAPPVVETGNIDKEVPFLDCGDFAVVDHVLGTYRSTSFADNQGTLLKIVTISNGTDNLYNPDNSSVVLTGHFTSVDTDNKVTGEWTSSGTFFSINIPDYGKVLKGAGRYRASTDRFVGVWTLNDESAELVCATLAGE